MLEFYTRGNCEDCIDRQRITLLSLAGKYKARDHWLIDSGYHMPGNYSLFAIHAMARRIDTDKHPFDIRGPFLREDEDLIHDESQLQRIKSTITDNSLTNQEISILADIARRRERSYNTFLNAGRNYWIEQGKKTQPFLQRLEKRDPAESQDIKERFQRVYWLDQGAFILAKMALGSCGGPWVRMCPFGEKFQRFTLPEARRIRS